MILDKKFINNKRKYTNLLIIFIAIVVIMYVLQQFLDPRRRISYHCLIRNFTIVFAVYYLINYKWSWYVFALPFVTELIIELLVSNCILNLDPDENKKRLAETSLETYLDFICGPVGQGSFFQHQVTHYDPKHTEEVVPRYAELGQKPVQLIWGADDAWQVVDWAHRLHGAIPGSELHVLKDCGHFALEDQPEEISGLLVDFLKRQS